ncbi:FAD-dependent oxidoreductase [Deinococcus sp. VB142]|uniref:FAD-dependent oxidoreductase n=1 Tax=Deinococcus sp. VB142 TaxID=3112952 RepID=A0AAU6Q3D9_9DEIO
MKGLVVGAGIAGASVAYFLGRAGVSVTVLDAAQHTASHVPSALVNPVRGQSGQVEEDALEGMHLTWALIRELEAGGHVIPHGQTGVLRPVPDDKTRAKFERNLPPELRHEWVSPAGPLAPGWAHVLHLPDAGWVDGRALCEALLTASGARRVEGRWPGVDGSFDLTFLCGGSLGSTWAGERRTHRMGTMLRLDRAVSEVPLSFGAYLSPDTGGGVLGGTFEAPTPTWEPPRLPLASLRWLLEKGAALSDLSGVQVTGRWTGSRLSGLRCGPDEQGLWHLSGLGSKGFLLGPLLARRLVARALPAQASHLQ